MKSVALTQMTIAFIAPSQPACWRPRPALRRPVPDGARSAGRQAGARPTPTTACRPPGPSRTSRSPAAPCSDYPEFVRALAIVKLAAARGNHDASAPSGRTSCSKLSRWRARRSWRASTTTSFEVDLFQGGAGTSTNMNANEVIANVALEKMGHEKGPLRRRRATRRHQHVAIHQRLLSDGPEGGDAPIYNDQLRRASSSCLSKSFDIEGKGVRRRS